MNKTIAAAKLRPVFESHPWTEAREALRQMENATHFGKIVLKVQ
jgi:NADPH:quinone reductase-like Zn-dependent oxidoreductase